MKPVACESSTITMARYLSARSTIVSSCARYPSIEKTPSVAIIRRRLFCVLRSASSSAAMSPLAYRWRSALQRRMPSMIDAWLSASEMMASSSPSSVSKRPPFASKQDE